MKITDIRTDDGYNYTLTLEDGTEATLSSALAGCLKEQFLLQELRDGITNVLDDEINGGYIDMSKHEYSREDFEEEIYTDLADEISCGDYTALCNDGEYIREKVTDLADYYELEPDDEYDEEEDE